MFEKRLLAVPIIALLLAGCHQAPVTATPPTSRSISDAIRSGLSSPVPDDSLKAVVCPPLGWKPDPPKITSNHRHQVWLSQTGATAYGVIYFRMPLPLGVDFVLSHFLSEMKKSEGEANLLSKMDDDKLPGIRFDAEGGLYRIRSNMMVDGFHGWVVYAGTLRSREINPAELQVAEKAREQTRVNLP